MAYYEYVGFPVYERDWHLVDLQNNVDVDIREMNAFMRDHAGDGRYLYTSKNLPGGGCTFFVYCENPDTAFALKMKFG